MGRGQIVINIVHVLLSMMILEPIAVSLGQGVARVSVNKASLISWGYSLVLKLPACVVAGQFVLAKVHSFDAVSQTPQV